MTITEFQTLKPGDKINAFDTVLTVLTVGHDGEHLSHRVTTQMFKFPPVDYHDFESMTYSRWTKVTPIDLVTELLDALVELRDWPYDNYPATAEKVDRVIAKYRGAQ